ncbi:septation protein IspZ [Marivita sp. GX14005]|uniref:inner membrane-spanning protein YciB n=1 Tax=Marivita sp. GX14005 TaxID=2942276 RepID=UPI0020189D93|nr:septation protein IspZ [Marivita sp. GX14005]MCL3883246.1 septation protein IspZ [Marivita sp. GX14005]
MDRRLLLEFLPAIAFLFGNAAGGLFVGAGAALVATTLSVAVRWRWDGCLPWLAVSTLVLALILTGFGILLDDPSYVLVRPTVGAIAFATILAVGTVAKPSLLERTLGYRLRIETSGWLSLHIAWIALALLSAVANEVARRALSNDQWVFYNFVSDFALFALFWVSTRLIAERYWIVQSGP